MRMEKEFSRKIYFSLKKSDKENDMLATDKISKAFAAICEEVDKIKKDDLSEKTRKRLKSIVSIAKHQSDIRGSKKGACKAHKKKCC